MAVAGTSRSSGGGIAVVDLTAREKKRAYNASVIFGARGSQSSSEAFSSKKFQASVTFDDAYHENVPILSSGTNNSDTLVAFYPKKHRPAGLWTPTASPWWGAKANPVASGTRPAAR